MNMDDRVKAYLKELAEVSKRHGLFISSCDCCTGIKDAEGNEVKTKHLPYGIGYNEKTDSY